MILIDGEFYIDNTTDDFYLREASAWDKKGRLFRSNIVGMLSEAIYPFTDGQTFELAPSATRLRFHEPFSQLRSSVKCDFPAAADCTIIFTDNLAGFLSTGTNVICSAAMSAVSQSAVLTFNDTTVEAFASLWLIMPTPADVAMAGLRAMFAGEPV